MEHLEQRSEGIGLIGLQKDAATVVVGVRALHDRRRHRARVLRPARHGSREHRVRLRHLRGHNGPKASVGLIVRTIRMVLADESQVRRPDLGPGRIRGHPEHAARRWTVHAGHGRTVCAPRHTPHLPDLAGAPTPSTRREERRMTDLAARLAAIVTPEHMLTGAAISDDYGHDEALTVAAVPPAYVVRPPSTAEVSALLAAANETGTPVTARGSGTGLSGACTPTPDSIVISFERMNRV